MNDIFDYLENAADDEMNMLTDKTPELSDAQIERLLEMSEKKYNRVKNTDADSEHNETEVSGVERYHRPIWNSPMLTAAACVALIIGVTVFAVLMKKAPIDNGPVDVPPDIFATVTSSESASSGTNTAAAGSTVYRTVTSAQSTAAASETTSTEPVSTTSYASSATSDIQTEATVTTTDSPATSDSAVQSAQIQTTTQQSGSQSVYFIPDYSDGIAASTEYDQQIANEAMKVYDDFITLVDLFDITYMDKIDMSDTFDVVALNEDLMLGTVSDRTSTYARFIDPQFKSTQDIKDFINSCVTKENNFYSYQFSGDVDLDGYPVPVITPGCRTESVMPPKYCDYDGKLYICLDRVSAPGDGGVFRPTIAEGYPMLIKNYPDIEQFKVMIPLKPENGGTLFGDPNAPERYVLEFHMIKQSDGLYKRDSFYDGALYEYLDIVDSIG